jgi:hypothetical protein
VFLHITDRAQLPTANKLQAELRDLRIHDQSVATPAVRFVAQVPHRTEVRCLKRSDCAAAERVARQVAKSLGNSVPVVDMSATYEGDTGVRAGSLELWLRP